MSGPVFADGLEQDEKTAIQLEWSKTLHGFANGLLGLKI